MKIIWSPSARADLISVRAYIGQDNPKAAQATAKRLFAAAEQLAEFPASGRPGRLPHTRELVVTGTPFILPYRVRDGTVEIIAVLHGSRKWPQR